MNLAGRKPVPKTDKMMRRKFLESTVLYISSRYKSGSSRFFQAGSSTFTLWLLRKSGTCLLIFLCLSYCPAPQQQEKTREGWQLEWSDEFNTNGLPDSSKWNYDTGGHGWGNGELQLYTQKDTANAVQRNGHLVITARKQEKGGNQYTSARLVTRNKAHFLYGKIVVRAKLPAGRGTWPAIWMLGSNFDKAGWPACGEIDMMEHVGFNKDSIFGTVHTDAFNHMKGTQKGKGAFIRDPYTSFHDYAIEWTPEKIRFLLDNAVYNEFINEHRSFREWPFDQPFYLILNVAVGGGWGGAKGVDDAIFPAAMEIDYVRVYKKKPAL